MSSVPAGKRLWKCPDCGGEVLLSITELDPMACQTCMAKLKGKSPSGGTGAASAAVPAEPMRLLIVGIAMLVIGLVVGFIAGRWSVPPPPFVRPTRPAEDPASTSAPSSKSVSEPVAEPSADTPDESTRPGPGYKWVKGYVRKDGVKVKGHWAKDSHAKP